MDIRNFFSRKRKNCDNDTDDNLAPAAKKRRVTTDSNNKENHKDNTKESNTNNVTNSNSENDIIPSIKSLKIIKPKDDKSQNDTSTKQENNNNEHEEEKCVSEHDNDENNDDDYIDEELSDQDDDITTTNSNNSTTKTKTTSISSITVSKTKESSLKESCKYDVVKECGFKSSSTIEYIVISDLFDNLGSTTKRLEKIEMMSRVFRSILHLKKGYKDEYSSLLYCIYLCCNEIAPPYLGIELGIGDSIILKALCESTGRKLRDIKKEYTSHGDLGDVAVNCRSKQNTLFKPKPLTINVVFETLKKIASTSGSGSQQEKVRNIQRLFVAASSSESRYIVRHLQGKLRIGVNEQTVLAALGRALAFDEMEIYNKNSKKEKKINYQKIADLENEYTSIIKQCVSQLPNYEMIVESLIKYGIKNLSKHCHLTSGIPIKAMLAKPTKGISEILKRFENLRFTLEYKYDGERAQIHLLSDGSIKIFSRNAEDNTQKFPELIESVQKFKNENVNSFIIDSEIVAFDRENNTILPFSTLITRKRKNVNAKDIKVSVCIYAFDCLLINDKPLISSTFAQRRQSLYDNFKEINGEFKFAHHKDTDDSEEILEYLNQAVSVGKCEGLMIKTLDIDATYEPSKRSHNWLKCKKDYLDGIGDTLDLVVMGAFHGTGKRTNTFGSYLVGCYNEDEDTYQSCCKVATGFKDDDLINLDKEMKKHLSKTNKKPIEYETSYECQVWFEPVCVWEIKCADLTISPTHFAAAGLAHESKGIALRFPRYLRQRDDKQATSASTSQQIYEMYAGQAILQ